jgi:hypothetical protein
MTEPFSFQWEGSSNPNDPSGVARFKVRGQSVSIVMHSFLNAEKLRSLIEKACDISKQQTIDRAVSQITDLLKTHRYD